MGQRIHSFQLTEAATGKAITSAGGMVFVTANGSNVGTTLYDSAGATVTNPAALTQGRVEVRVADSVETVDMYILSPTGHFTVLTGIKAGGVANVLVDTQQRLTHYVIPFDVTDSNITAATEYDTGFELPANDVVLPWGIGVMVETIDATETIDVGLLSTESGGDANGFMALVSVAGAGFIPAASVVTSGLTENYFSSTTLGALLVDFTAGADDANADVGTNNPKHHVGDGTATTISLTLTAGTDTAAGKVVIPVLVTP